MNRMREISVQYIDDTVKRLSRLQMDNDDTENVREAIATTENITETWLRLGELLAYHHYLVADGEILNEIVQAARQLTESEANLYLSVYIRNMTETRERRRRSLRRLRGSRNLLDFDEITV